MLPSLNHFSSYLSSLCTPLVKLKINAINAPTSGTTRKSATLNDASPSNIKIKYIINTQIKLKGNDKIIAVINPSSLYFLIFFKVLIKRQIEIQIKK